MKTLILIIILLSGTLQAEHFKFTFDNYYHWMPILKLTRAEPFHSRMLINPYVVKYYHLETGMIYRFSKDNYILFKTEYATDYTGSGYTFDLFDREPILKFEFRMTY